MFVPHPNSIAAVLAANRRAHQQSVEEYYRNPNQCLGCNTIIAVHGKERVCITRKRRFCSRSCAGTYNNKQSPKRVKSNRCATCQTLIYANRKYCSADCKSIGRSAHSNKSEQKSRLAKYVATWRQRTKLRAVAYKGGCCQICGYNRSMRAMIFHHQEPEKKDFSISRVTRAWDSIKNELDKCVLLCANCHAEVHDGLISLPTSSALPAVDSNHEHST